MIDEMVSEWPNVIFTAPRSKYRCEAGHVTEYVSVIRFQGPDEPTREYVFCYECQAAWLAKQWPLKRVDGT